MPRGASGGRSLPAATALTLRKPARLRNLEVPLLLGAMLVTAGAIALVDLGTGATFDPALGWELAALVVLLIVMHVVLRVTAPDADPFVIPIAVVLGGIGIAE